MLVVYADYVNSHILSKGLVKHGNFEINLAPDLEFSGVLLGYQIP